LRVLSPCLLLLAGCDGSGGGAPISSQVLAGKIGGQAWTFVQGETDAFLSDGNTFWVNLYASAFSACESFAAPIDENQILIQIPRTGGSYDLSLAQNATFYLPPGDNYVATRGHVQIDAITPTAITGGARITYDGDNTVEGQFQASICP
jgi:hypothetical protein